MGFVMAAIKYVGMGLVLCFQNDRLASQGWCADQVAVAKVVGVGTLCEIHTSLRRCTVVRQLLDEVIPHGGSMRLIMLPCNSFFLTCR